MQRTQHYFAKNVKEKIAKNATFSCIEGKRTQRTKRSFQKERKEGSVLFPKKEEFLF